MNLQQTFVGMLGTVGTVTAFNRNAKAAEYNAKVNERKSAYDLKTALREEEFSKNEDIIKSETKAYLDWQSKTKEQFKKADDKDSYNHEVNKYNKDLETRYGKEVASQIIEEVAWKNSSKRGKAFNTQMRRDANLAGVDIGYKSPTTLRAEAFAKERWDRMNNLYDNLNTLKKQYNIGGTK